MWCTQNRILIKMLFRDIAFGPTYHMWYDLNLVLIGSVIAHGLQINRSSDQSCTSGMAHTKLHLITTSCLYLAQYGAEMYPKPPFVHSFWWFIILIFPRYPCSCWPPSLWTAWFPSCFRWRCAVSGWSMRGSWRGAGGWSVSVSAYSRQQEHSTSGMLSLAGQVRKLKSYLTTVSLKNSLMH